MTDRHLERKASLLVVVVFALGAALGGVGTHYWEARAYGTRVIVPTHTELVKQLTDQLSLTPDQQKQVSAITEEVRNHLRSIQDQQKPDLDAVRNDGRKRIRALLTSEQQPKYDEFIRHLDELRAKAAA